MSEDLNLQPVLVAGEWQPADRPIGSFTAANPATRTPLPDRYPVSSVDEVDRACVAGHAAATALSSAPRCGQSHRGVSRHYADAIDSAAVRWSRWLRARRGWPYARLHDVELPRTTNRLRQGAHAARDRSWCHATIDTKTNIRSCYSPLADRSRCSGRTIFRLRSIASRAAISLRPLPPAIPSLARPTPAIRARRGCWPSSRCRRRNSAACHRDSFSCSIERRPPADSGWCHIPGPRRPDSRAAIPPACN